MLNNWAKFIRNLKPTRALIYKILESEISKFAANLVRGQAILKNILKNMRNDKIVTGAQAFKLYDTYGFPIELIRVMAKKKVLPLMMLALKKRWQNNKNNQEKKQLMSLDHLVPDEVTTEFTGYQELETASKLFILFMMIKSLIMFLPGKPVG